MKLSTKTKMALWSIFNLFPKNNKFSKLKRCSKFEHISIEILLPRSIIDFICIIVNRFKSFFSIFLKKYSKSKDKLSTCFSAICEVLIFIRHKLYNWSNFLKKLISNLFGFIFWVSLFKYSLIITKSLFSNSISKLLVVCNKVFWIFSSWFNTSSLIIL